MAQGSRMDRPALLAQYGRPMWAHCCGFSAAAPSFRCMAREPIVLEMLTICFWRPSLSKGRKAAVTRKVPTTFVANTCSKSSPCLHSVRVMGARGCAGILSGEQWQRQSKASLFQDGKEAGCCRQASAVHQKVNALRRMLSYRAGSLLKVRCKQLQFQELSA